MWYVNIRYSEQQQNQNDDTNFSVPYIYSLFLPTWKDKYKMGHQCYKNW